MRVKRMLLIASISLIALALWAEPQTKTAEKTIEITESRFQFQPNEITVTRGQEVILLLHSTDVTHGLVVEALGIPPTDEKKGKPTPITFVADKVGTFEGKCSHFCGSGHGSMKITIHVIEPTGASQ